MQEAYVRAFRELAGFRGEARFSTWLTRIACHEALARARKRRRLVPSPPWPPIAAAASLRSRRRRPPVRNGDGEPRAAGLLREAVELLPDPLRAVFCLREIEGSRPSRPPTLSVSRWRTCGSACTGPNAACGRRSTPGSVARCAGSTSSTAPAATGWSSRSSPACGLTWADPQAGPETTAGSSMRSVPAVASDLDLGSDRQGELLLDVADHRSAPGGDAEGQQMVAEHVGDGQRAEPFAGRALGAVPPDHRPGLAQDAGEPELGEHAVDPVGRLLHVLDEEDAAVPIRQIARSDEARQHRQVAAEQPPPGGAGAQGLHAVLDHREIVLLDLLEILEGDRLTLLKHPFHVADVERVPLRGAHRSMEGHQAVFA